MSFGIHILHFNADDLTDCDVLVTTRPNLDEAISFVRQKISQYQWAEEKFKVTDKELGTFFSKDYDDDFGLVIDTYSMETVQDYYCVIRITKASSFYFEYNLLNFNFTFWPKLCYHIDNEKIIFNDHLTFINKTDE